MMNYVRTTFNLSSAVLWTALFVVSSCMAPTEEGTITFKGLSGSEGAKTKNNPSSNTNSSALVTSVSIVNDQLVINGSDLAGVTTVRITGPSSFDETFAIETKTSSSIIANGLSNVAFAMNGLFDLVLTDVNGAATFQVTFTLQDGSVTASKLASMGATSGQVLQFNGTSWVPSDLDGLSFSGNWNATTNSPDLTSGGSAGEFYIVATAGSFDLSGGPGTNSWSVGDWVMWNNGSGRWDKVANGNNVTSFNGRNGPVVSATNDYTWAQIDKTTAPIGDLSNVNTTGAISGSVLKFDGTNWVVGTDDTAGAGSVDSTAITDGTIVNADINASAAIDQSKIANLTTDLAAKENSITAGTTAQYYRGDKTFQTLDTSAVTENSNLYFTDTRARTAAVVNSAAGSQTDQAASVAAMKSYVSANAGTGNFMADGSVTMTGNLNLATHNLITSGTVDGVDVSVLNTTVAGKENAISAGTTAQYYRGDKTFVTLNTDAVTEGTSLYHTTARARAAAVLNSTAGSETDQAASVSAMKSYVDANSGGSIQSPVTTTDTTGASCSNEGELSKNASDELMVCEDSSLDGADCSSVGVGAFTLDSNGDLYVCSE